MSAKITEPGDYLHIMVWGLQMGSLRAYIVREQDRAFAAAAPADAIYERNGVWHTIGEAHPLTQNRVEEGVAALRTRREEQRRRSAEHHRQMELHRADRLLGAEDLRAKYSDTGEHPQWRKKDWVAEVALDDTLLGYWAWVEHRIEAED